MHPEVVTDAAGSCPICRMALVAVRLDSVWSCQLHPDVTKFAAGRCPIDGRSLVQMIKAVSFTCPVHPRVVDVNPGRCPIDKRPLVAKYSLRPHGDHNPKHGGQFFMAPNNWHVEVTHPAPAVFRPSLGLKLSARSIPFARAPRGPVLEARVPRLALPATIAVKVRFQADDQEYRFDFPFLTYSKEPT